MLLDEGWDVWLSGELGLWQDVRLGLAMLGVDEKVFGMVLKNVVLMWRLGGCRM